MVNGMHIAVAGGHGFLGQYVVQNLLSQGAEITILTRHSCSPDNKPGVTCCTTDYSVDQLAKQLAGCDALVNLAAERGISDSLSSYYPSINVCESLYLACSRVNIRNIVFASTISVYGSPDKMPWAEDQLPDPVSLYGISKLACEALGNWFSHSKDLAVKNLRFAHIYGANEKNNYMINLFLRKALNRMPLSLNAPASAKREFLYAKDAANGVLRALHAASRAGTYNISSGESLTNMDVAAKINRACGNTPVVEIKNEDGAEGIRSSHMSGAKAKRELGFQAEYSMEKALTEICEEMAEMQHIPVYY